MTAGDQIEINTDWTNKINKQTTTTTSSTTRTTTIKLQQSWRLPRLQQFNLVWCWQFSHSFLKFSQTKQHVCYSIFHAFWPSRVIVFILRLTETLDSGAARKHWLIWESHRDLAKPLQSQLEVDKFLLSYYKNGGRLVCAGMNIDYVNRLRQIWIGVIVNWYRKKVSKQWFLVDPCWK